MRSHDVPDAACEQPEATAGPEPTAPDTGDEKILRQPRPAGARNRIWKPLRWAAASVSVLAIGGLATASTLMMLQHRDVLKRERQQAEYIAAARQGVVTLMSLNFNTVDEDIKRVIDNSTGDFKKDFEAQAENFSRVAKESKAVTETTSTSAGIESLTDTDAVVLVAVSTKVSNVNGAVDEPRNWRLSVQMTRDGNQIKMSKVDFAP